jgi:naphthoate synthase/2-ketocyclohexanecarboxyl-CoA hydrolase
MSTSIPSSPPTYPNLRLERRDAVTVLYVNRPNVMNAINRETLAEIADATRAFVADPAQGALIVTGAGEKAFISGADINELAPLGPAAAEEISRFGQGVVDLLEQSPKPVIAAVNGYAVGAGHELHLMCDITIAADHAKFGQTGAKIGSVPVAGATQLLPRLVGEKKAREILFMCKQYTAQEAFNMGLVNLVVPASELYPTVDKWCQDLLEKSPEGLRIAKTSLNQESDKVLWASMFAGFEMLSLHTGSDEFKEGTSSFIEKRKANFKPYRSKARAVAG